MTDQPITTVQIGRHQAQQHLAHAAFTLLGETGLSKQEQIERLHHSAAIAAEALAAIQATIALAESRDFEAHQTAKHLVNSVSADTPSVS